MLDDSWNVHLTSPLVVITIGNLYIVLNMDGVAFFRPVRKE